MKYTAYIFTLLLFLGTSQIPAEPGSQVRLLMPGTWHGDEVRARHGERFHAITASVGRHAPLPVRLKIRTVHDPVVDGDSGEKTGKDVGVNRPVKELSFLVKGLEFPKGRGTRTIFASGSGEIKFGRSLVFKGLDDEPVKIRLGRSPAGATITLESSAGRQALASFKIDQHKSPQLIWAGDIDGDNQLDLLLDTSNHYNVSKYTLFLSSRKGKKRFVGKSAVFRTTGC